MRPRLPLLPAVVAVLTLPSAAAAAALVVTVTPSIGPLRFEGRIDPAGGATPLSPEATGQLPGTKDLRVALGPGFAIAPKGFATCKREDLATATATSFDLDLSPAVQSQGFDVALRRVVLLLDKVGSGEATSGGDAATKAPKLRSCSRGPEACPAAAQFGAGEVAFEAYVGGSTLSRPARRRADGRPLDHLLALGLVGAANEPLVEWVTPPPPATSRGRHRRARAPQPRRNGRRPVTRPLTRRPCVVTPRPPQLTWRGSR